MNCQPTLISIGTIGVPSLRSPFRYHPWLPEDPFERVRSRGENLPDEFAVEVARHRAIRSNPLPDSIGGQIFTGHGMPLLQIPRDRLRIPRQGKLSTSKIETRVA